MVAPLDRALYADIVRRALEEDIGSGDVTTEATVAPDARGRGVFLAKTACILAGLDVAFEVFRQAAEKGTGAVSAAAAWASTPAVNRPETGKSAPEKGTGVVFTSHRRDGEPCAPGEEFANVAASARTLLIAERTALNLLQRLSGVATWTRRFVDAAGGRITILDTRKTTPNLRVLEKYAVRAGGATNHRAGLFDAVLIKDNHVRLAGGVSAAVTKARAHRPDLAIEVEAQTLEQVDEALAAKAELILVDNMSSEQIREAVRRARGRAKVEISGGVTLDRIPELAATGADFVSIGALTHSAPAVDISFEIEPL